MSEPNPFGDLTAADMSHAMLIAILMHNGGGYTLPFTAFEVDALGRPDGAQHAVQMVPLADGSGVRLMVIARPDGDEAVLRVQPYEPPPQE